MKKIILPILIIALLLVSCTRENEEFNSLLTTIEDFEENINLFISDIEQDISNNADAYSVLNKSNISSPELLTQTEKLRDELSSFNDEVDSELLEEAGKKIDTIYNNLTQCESSANDYYASYVKSEIITLLSDYENTEDKSTVDTQNAEDLVYQLNSLTETSVFDDVLMQGQSTLLSSFISCRDSYNDWLESSAEFAETSITSDSMENSKKIVEDYLTETNEYYDNHTQAMDTASSLDKELNDNADAFLELFEPYTNEYEATIENLESILAY